MLWQKIRLYVLILPLLAFGAWHASLYWFQCDDAFITYRYAYNLVHGHGAVFNAGDRVEGYTNFLWLLEMAGIWKITGVPPEKSAVFMSALYSIGVVWLTVLMARGGPFHRLRWASVWAAVFLLVTNRNVAVWTSSGLETRQFTFFAVLAVWLLGRYRAGAAGPVSMVGSGGVWVVRRALILASISLAFCELTRPEGLLMVSCSYGWLVITGLTNTRGKNGWSWGRKAKELARETLLFMGPFILIVGVHLLWRKYYYDEWVPNTYYAKHVRRWLESGAYYWIQATIENGLYVVVPMAFVGAVARWRTRRDATHFLSFFLILPHAVYLLDIGGDHFEFRPLDFYWPLLAVAAVDCMAWVGQWGYERFQTLSQGRRSVLRGSIFAVLFSVCALYSTVVQVAHAKQTLRLQTVFESAEKTFPIDGAETRWAMWVPGVSSLAPLYEQAQRYGVDHLSCTRFSVHRGFARLMIEQYRPYKELAINVVPEGAIQTYGSIGAMGYYLPTVTFIDQFGLTDKVISKHPVETPNEKRKMAHDRRPPPGYLEKRGVNLFIHGAAKSQADALRAGQYAVQLKDGLWMPIDSIKPDWVEKAMSKQNMSSRGQFSIDKPENNSIWVSGRRFVGVRFLGLFETGLDDWRQDGQAMAEQPKFGAVAKQLKIQGHVGRGLVNSYHALTGDKAQGTLLSPEFQANSGELLVFLIAGGQNHVGVRLLAGGKEVRSWSGANSETLSTVSEDLSALAGQMLQLEIFDRSSGGWGHVLVDHIFIASGDSSKLLFVRLKE